MAKGKRLAKKVTIDELEAVIKKKIDKNDDYDDYESWEEINVPGFVHSQTKLSKDLEKVEFDMENYFFDESLDGYNSIGDFSYLGVTAGGDWEFPVFFIIYLDTKSQLRGYIPTEGNTFNVKTKTAIGNDEDEDIKYINSIAPKGTPKLTEDEDFFDRISFDWDLIEKDILNRIEVEA